MRIRFEGTKIGLFCSNISLLIFFSCCPFFIEAADYKPLSDSLYIRKISISGNKITKQPVILKELLFKNGDFIKHSELLFLKKKSIDNLLNTSLFNYVYIDFEIVQEQSVDVNIRVEERWYLWIAPIFEHADRNLSSFFHDKNWEMINYGLSMSYDNFRGRHEKIRFRFRIGYFNQFFFDFESPEYEKMWGWGFWVDNNYYDQVAIKTINNRPYYLSTFGNQIYSSLSDAVYVQLRSGIYKKHKFVLKYASHFASDTIISVNSNFLPDATNRFDYLAIQYQYTYDDRNSKYYPLTGNMYQMDIEQTGLGILNKQNNFLKFTGRMYYYNSLRDKIFIGSEWNGSYSTTNNCAYYTNNGIGYKQFIRGYEYYVIDGSAYFFSKNKISYEMVSLRIKDLNIKWLSKFSKIHYALYLGAFYDFGYVLSNNEVNNLNNNLVNSFMHGFGVGIDLVTIYDKALSLNYALNKHGEHGFFVHINLKM
ncbi:MAG: hypothetical protein JW717_04435 [Marinilabiliaceae bacterium]|nr:hypothetical protein [Marinilabiliaceae bacterium]